MRPVLRPTLLFFLKLDNGVVRATQQGRGHLFIYKHSRPFCKAEVGGNDDAGSLAPLSRLPDGFARARTVDATPKPQLFAEF